MKKLALLLFFCAMAFAPLANAQDCPYAISCTMDPSCGNCHYQADPCQHETHIHCLDCNTACTPMDWALNYKAPKAPIAAPGHVALTDLGAAFMAATMPSFLRNPLAFGRLPKNHPPIAGMTLERLQARMAARNKLVGVSACKAPASIQLLTASMLHK